MRPGISCRIVHHIDYPVIERHVFVFLFLVHIPGLLFPGLNSTTFSFPHLIPLQFPLWNLLWEFTISPLTAVFLQKLLTNIRRCAIIPPARGCYSTARMSAFQAECVGSTPITRSKKKRQSSSEGCRFFLVLFSFLSAIILFPLKSLFSENG